jgi:hypothetical protein
LGLSHSKIIACDIEAKEYTRYWITTYIFDFINDFPFLVSLLEVENLLFDVIPPPYFLPFLDYFSVL